MAQELATAAECPPDGEFVELLEGGHPASVAARLQGHLAACGACRALVDELMQGEADLARILARGSPAETGGRGATIGRYRVLSLIGRGGMGDVHAAYDPELDRRVALKLLRTARSSAGARKRLMREARALGKLSHPNVVQVYDVGEHEGDVFLAMELVEGQAFDAWCRSTPAPGWRAVLAAYLDAARGLSAAHDKGVIHRDVKPSNILRGADGRVRVVDFGLAVADETPSVDEAPSPPPPAAAAVAVDASDATWPADPEGAPLAAPSANAGAVGIRTEPLTTTGALVGTPLYMAPEQYEGSRATPASDQYSLCTALYEALHGVLPFAARADARMRLGEIMAQKKAGPPAAPPAGSPVPAWVHAALARGLSPRPEDRYPSMNALIAAMIADAETDPMNPGLGAHGGLREPGAEAAGRVPRPLTPLVGREGELGEITSRVRASRLITLTGTGGIGKSRLALQVASDLAGDFAGGAWFVELAPLSDPDLVVATVASVLGVHDAPGRPPLDALVASLRSRRVFLVLDNCEHVLDAASRLADRLLQACPGLTILATSRQSLGLTGEVAWRVPSLNAEEAVALFHVRAGQKDDPATVAQICQRLDGIPLAIELAAARTRVLSVAQIAARLDDRFRLLTDGSRAALPRHRTLKAAVDWGYQLLHDEEQALLRRLSVFAGGFTLEAAEAVAGRDVLDPLANLVDKSLVVFAGRYRLLETVRQYAAERLAERGETDEARARHLDHFVALAEAAAPHIFGGDGREWVDRLEEEHDNLRAAFDFCEADPRDARRAEAALRLASALHWFWFARGHLREARERMDAALRRRALASPTVRARALVASGPLAMWVGDFTAMGPPLREGLAIARNLGDLWLSGYALANLTAAAVNTGDTAAARGLAAEAVATARAAGVAMLLCFVQYWAGTAQHAGGDLTAARRSLDEGLAIAEQLGSRAGIGHNLFRLGEVAESAGDHDEAERRYVASLRTLAGSADGWGMVQVIDAMARLSVTVGHPDRGARLFGAVEALSELIGAQVLASERRRDAVATARGMLGTPAFAAAWSEGRAQRPDQAVSLACGD
jgi:non-specific serine/threonine protein kinase